ncbi:TetR family transcriptional regulator [Rhodococcus sp. OK519]|uniref:ScbR family autoregulator-binding transcription factor n=1 Tax=Rhodococcus sp. OK519 TaxID=2135729 RepID=UPI000D378BA6|nr:TetR family transcriptional regulator [Rhodococcus sp. OK519]
MAQQARAVATRQQIVLRAAEVFDRVGYYGARVEEIVESARITKGALYFHFGSKDDLAHHIIREQHLLAVRATEAIAATEASALEQMVMLCHEMARQTYDPIVRAGIRLTVELGATDALGDAPADPYLPWTDSATRLVARAVEQGDIAESVSPPVLARHLIAAVTGTQLVSRVRTWFEDVERRVDEMWGVLLPGIVPVNRRDRIGPASSARWCAEMV